MSSSAIKAGEAYVQLALRGREKVSAGLKRVTANFRAVAKASLAIGAIAGGSLALVAGALAPAVKAASDMQETMAKFEVVFGESSKEIKEWSDNFALSVGRSKREVADFLASNQDLFIPMGFDAEGAQEISKTLTALSVDLASFNNKEDQAVLTDLQAAMTGSGEVMKKYGVILSEAAVKQELMNQGLDPKAANNQQKALARLNIILAGTTSAQGDAIRSGESFANQQKRALAILDDLKVSVGGALLPVLSTWLEEMNSLASVFLGASQDGDGLVSTVDDIGDAIANVGSPIEFLARGMALVAAQYRLAQGAIAATVSGLAALIELSAKTGVATYLLGDSAEGIAEYAAAISNDLDKRANQQFALAKENLDLAFSDELTKRMKEQIAKTRQAAKEASVSYEKTTLAKSRVAGPAREVVRAREEASQRARTYASPEALEANSIQSFIKFQENRQGEQARKDRELQKTLKQLNRLLQNPRIQMVEVRS